MQSVLKLITREEKAWCQVRLKKREHMFSSVCKELGNRIKGSVLNNANPSNLGRSPLKGTKDHPPGQARSDIMKNIKLDLSTIAPASPSNKPVLKDWNYRTHNTYMLNLDENKFVHKKNYL